VSTYGLLPSVDEVLRQPGVAELLERHPRPVVVAAVRECLGEYRARITGGLPGPASRESLRGAVVAAVRERVAAMLRSNLRPVINATGVVLHTNLGRAVLGAAAAEAVERMVGYCNLELNLETGKRGSRYAAVEELLKTLTGAEAALVVNNNAAAVLLALSTLARDREVIVSRGQLIEIGGSFRMPDVMAASGARLVEVGTTNKTYPEDYRRAVGERTALLLWVHTSNYRIVGFTREVRVEELVALGREYGLPVMCDLGSGSLVDLRPWGLPHEPAVQEVVAAGADVVTFSGDKLLGGPQAGIIVGRAAYVGRMKGNPLTRAVRIDKLTLAALEATLREYRDHREEVHTRLPVLRMLTVPASELARRARAFAARLGEILRGRAEVQTQPGFSRVGGGALPTAELPSTLVAVAPLNVTVEELQVRLRKGDPPVVARVREGWLLLDLRTVPEDQEPLLEQALGRALA